MVLPERKLRVMHLFAGTRGGILGDILLGHVPVVAVEIEDYRRKILLARQRDGILPKFPIWDDVKTFDGRPWRGFVDVVAGGFPCQDISCAGKGEGIKGERSGLWKEMSRIIGEVRPKIAFMENSPMLTSRGLDRVLGDLSEMGYNARWGVLGACCTGAPQPRERIWIMAYSKVSGNKTMQKTNSKKHKERGEGKFRGTNGCGDGRGPWIFEPRLDRVVDGVSNRVERTTALGDAQVPAVVRLAWEILTAKN